MKKSKKTVKRKKKVFILKIFIKKKRRPFFEIQVPDESYLNLFYEAINLKKEYELIYYHMVIFRKEDFDYAIIKETEV